MNNRIKHQHRDPAIVPWLEQYLPSVFAAETNTVSQLTPSVAKVNTVSPKVETQGIKTAALKKAVLTLADMLESQAIKKLLDFVEDYGSKKVADTIREYTDNITDTLRTIASWKDLSIQIIQDQVSGRYMIWEYH
ncbi:hypothetical protein [Geobacillus stearothermophilus]|uniref:hypothetical protein n=1 Tax=Geobacillus stearothermophilus TaxID=1422 RepID=UPI0011AB557E|nr:hypothetical protein [Geobacillus stearothermophilus]MDF9298053.1 hypothetical protein [Geobacillus stearothermophilus]